MAHNVCCNSYRVYNVTCIYHTTVPILGVNYVTGLACCFLGPLFTDWASGYYVRCGCIGSPVFSFPFYVGVWAGSFHLFFVVCYCFLFSLYSCAD